MDGGFNVYEEPIDFFQVPETKAATLFAVIKDVLLRCSLPLERCRGQGYDGASNMMWKVTGVAKRFKEEQQAALTVHCLAHCVNLVLQDSGHLQRHQNHKECIRSCMRDFPINQTLS